MSDSIVHDRSFNAQYEKSFLKENQNLKLLYIEDDTQIRTRYVTFLKRYFNEVYEAGCIKDALLHYENHKPDIVIVDLNLPDGNGLSLLQKIRKSDINSKAIILTAYNDLDFVLEATELKLTKYLIKPVSRDILKTALQSAVDEINKYELIDKTHSLLRLNDDYTFDTVNADLYFHEELLDITPKQKKILNYLVDPEKSKIREIIACFLFVTTKAKATYSNRVSYTLY